MSRVIAFFKIAALTALYGIGLVAMIGLVARFGPLPSIAPLWSHASHLLAVFIVAGALSAALVHQFARRAISLSLLIGALVSLWAAPSMIEASAMIYRDLLLILLMPLLTTHMLLAFRKSRSTAT